VKTPLDAVDGSDETGDAESGTGDLSSDASRELVKEASTSLVEVVPGAAVVFGEVPPGFELIDFGLISNTDRDSLSAALSSVGNATTVAGNVANQFANAKGLYRVTEETLAILKSGGELASKDGAKLGTIIQNGKFAQARFIPYGVTAAQTAAALGPAIAMIAIQMQLSEISGLVKTNIALTTQTLKTIRHEQWAELTGVSKSIDRAIEQANEVGSVTESLWDSVSGNQSLLDKQLDLYRRNVSNHVQQLGALTRSSRRQYIEANAEAVLFDAHALLHSLKAQTGYQGLRAALARHRSSNNQHEAHLVDVITRDARAEFELGLEASRELVGTLTRELRIIAELPGRATIPLTKKRRDSKASRLTCGELLAAIEPLANVLQPPVAALEAPELISAPEGLELEPYLQILRWYLADDEELRGVVFPYEQGSHGIAEVLRPELRREARDLWTKIAPQRLAADFEKFAFDTSKGFSTFVALTNSRVITAHPKDLLRQGHLGASFPLEDIRFVRPPRHIGEGVKHAIDVITEHRDISWVFPSYADKDVLVKFAALLDESVVGNKGRLAAVDSPGALPEVVEAGSL